MCHESARYMSCAAVSQKGGSCCHERDFAPPSARRALVVHFSAGRSQRPLGVTVEDSPVPALLFSGCLRARVGRVRLDWPSLRRWILARMRATGCRGGKSRYGSYRLVYHEASTVYEVTGLMVVLTLVEALSLSLQFSGLLPFLPVSLLAATVSGLCCPSFSICSARLVRAMKNCVILCHEHRMHIVQFGIGEVCQCSWEMAMLCKYLAELVVS